MRKRIQNGKGFGESQKLSLRKWENREGGMIQEDNGRRQNRQKGDGRIWDTKTRLHTISRESSIQSQKGKLAMYDMRENKTKI